MAIKSFRAIAGMVSVVLEDGTALFTKSMDKNEIQNLFMAANGMKELSDAEIIRVFSAENISGMSTEEKEVVAERAFSKAIAEDSNKYPHVFEYKDGAYYRKGVNLSIPKSVLKKYMTALELGGAKEVKSIDNFWMWCSLNPNKYAREELLDFLDNGGYMLTPNGFFVAYRGVNTKEENNKVLTSFISQEYSKVKSWKKSPKNYYITETAPEHYTLERVTDCAPMGTIVGVLADLYANLANLSFTTVFTDAHTGKMKIKLGKEVRIDRGSCDESSDHDCSRGLHVGNVHFGVESFGKTVITCLVNPMNVVAVPKYNKNKLRTCAYFPMSVVVPQENEKGEHRFAELDYSQFEEEYFDEVVDKLSELAENNNPEELKTHYIDNGVDLKVALNNLENISQAVKDRLVS